MRSPNLSLVQRYHDIDGRKMVEGMRFGATSSNMFVAGPFSKQPDQELSRYRAN